MKNFLLLASAGMLLSCSEAPGDTAEAPAPVTDEAFEAQLVRVLDERPEIILEALENFQRRSEQQLIADVLPTLASAQAGHAIGASEEDASLILIEFFDYHCGFCQRAMDDVLALVEADPGVRVVFQELPILREESRQAARIAIAAAGLEGADYQTVHRALLETPGVLDEAAIERALRRAGVDAEAVTAALADNGEDIDRVLNQSVQIAQQLRIQGTPYFIAANPANGRYDVLEGYRPTDFEAFIEGARG
ncbi:DsbA family protein [Parvularcula maris]|uniref:DsbA family protein n=1 Tax=Parvularcula maris TaxID=2965077 RepID=A0A9X2L8U4_9PROT|nr:DsbA family protein [Parvularcula maris]MCQ8185098.1 DsbA family protein [Parvularcula maris]